MRAELLHEGATNGMPAHAVNRLRCSRLLDVVQPAVASRCNPRVRVRGNPNLFKPVHLVHTACTVFACQLWLVLQVRHVLQLVGMKLSMCRVSARVSARGFGAKGARVMTFTSRALQGPGCTGAAMRMALDADVHTAPCGWPTCQGPGWRQGWARLPSRMTCVTLEDHGCVWCVA